MMLERAYTALASINYKIVFAFLFISAVAVFAGLIASTGSLLLVQLLIGMIGGIALLKAPNVSIWILLSVALLYGVFASYVPALSKLPWALALISMLLLLPVLLQLITQKQIPAFIWLAIIFMLYALLVTFMQWDSMSQFLAGFKRYFQMYGLMFALALLAFKPKEYEHWLKLLLVIALIQLPFALFQRFMLGDISTAAAELTDRVAGTLGSSAEGGSSNAQMVAFLIMAATFVVARFREGLIEKSKTIWLCILCLMPLVLGETKIVVVLLPLVWFILMREEFKKHTSKFLLQLFAVLAVTSVLGLVYLGLNKGVVSGMTNTDIIKQTLEYNIGSQGYGTYILNRTTVIAFWWLNHDWHDLIGILFGHGLGSSYFNAGNAVAGNVAVSYIGYGIDLTSASSLLWDTGVFGLLLFISIFVFAWIAAGRLYKATKNPRVRADAIAIQACIAVFAVFIFYDNTLVNILSFELILATVFGYLGYLVHQQNMLTHDNSPFK
ncbi:MAG: hypothetical protein V4545_09025 [Pseudomonadota bacterium]